MPLLRLRTASFAFTLAASFATSLGAQNQPPRSHTSGLMFGAHAGATILSDRNTTADIGKGVGVTAGFGISRRFSVFVNADYSGMLIRNDGSSQTSDFLVSAQARANASRATAFIANPIQPHAFDRPAVAATNPPEFAAAMDVFTPYPLASGHNRVVHLDLGGRFAFANPNRAWIPYLDAAISQRIFNVDLYQGFPAYKSSGTAISAGAGLMYFVQPKLALDFNALVSSGGLEADGYAVDTDYSSTTTRINVGFKYFAKPLK